MTGAARSLWACADNHLGIYEEDEVRKHDSFTTFEEILVYAQNYKVDALLLGGDLFHDNKPSRCGPVAAHAPLRERRRKGYGRSAGGRARGCCAEAPRQLPPAPSYLMLMRRPTVVRTINLLRKYVMSDTPVSIEVLSDQATNFSQCVPRKRLRERL